ncbi:hypothetical protein [Gorillibacterium sp. CAU 1737]|uniref:hypothetical protein n=1 Tax=Gorillibacterium sp. CAU 1737 TaxID=3140362 RepID=UPI00325FE2E0
MRILPLFFFLQRNKLTQKITTNLRVTTFSPACSFWQDISASNNPETTMPSDEADQLPKVSVPPLEKDGSEYSLEWLTTHEAEDYRQKGITRMDLEKFMQSTGLPQSSEESIYLSSVLEKLQD